MGFARLELELAGPSNREPSGAELESPESRIFAKRRGPRARATQLLPIAIVLGLALGAGIGLLLMIRLGMTSLNWKQHTRRASSPAHLDGGPSAFSFAVTADMRYFSGPGIYDSPEYFRGALDAIAELGHMGEPIAFMISAGDMDPAPAVFWTITSTLGVPYAWYPAVGNHDLPRGGLEPSPGANLRWLQSYRFGDVNPGPTGCPTTTYSLDYGDVHFAILNEYCDAGGPAETDGDISDHLYQWLFDDLAGTDRRHTFVVGHEPAFPLSDAETGRIRHDGDSLDAHPANRDRFWRLLRDQEVTAFICGHTHNYSVTRIDGVWQVDGGHARGAGDGGAPSTFVVIHVEDEAVRYEAYRANAQGMDYTKRDAGYLVPRAVRLPLILRTRPV